jgi:hypothetical protein
LGWYWHCNSALVSDFRKDHGTLPRGAERLEEALDRSSPRPFAALSAQLSQQLSTSPSLLHCSKSQLNDGDRTDVIIVVIMSSSETRSVRFDPLILRIRFEFHNSDCIES